ncbi:MAG TPA: bifunctional oligoribonuclease/PAP phosphatase NrnA [Niabella sp.]|nr:bifunctional oligoribonuclease/PAP phosphatase NrnA [Niabella sp.]HOZ97448.1 bifunctional oligoribonuclease/PAP phosphatase NrnA [Niabella sp.]HQW15184.1 bifunctional oligoribonuclease/PAP phosphatase NrnA [Niabella sp.]HQX20349.1 bifunctional oligoribonuclease/PAP phosphatase NrnA [Niabella sp.]HQX41655.1 bifunctional oligoribonuclease/PAP phosphatase NrnA [Niabella sp.]
MNSIASIIPLLSHPSRIVITMHQKPDADAMGSALGLGHFLKKMGHEVTVISPTNWAAWLNWMPGCSEVINFEKFTEKAVEVLNNTQILFCLDFNIFHRTKNMASVLASLNCVKALIDHHEQPDAPSFDFGISETAKSSTCEMVYDFVVEAGMENSLDLTIAQCLYAGVVTDTGSFRFSSTKASVHLMVARLMATGLNHAQIHSNLFDNFLENRLRFIGHVLSNRLEFFYEVNTALIVITKQDLLKYEVKTGETEGLVNYPLSVQGIKFAGLVIDRDEERKWSFRSKGDFDCNTFARKYFNGGGHYNASGGNSKDLIPETVAKFKEAIHENETILQ